MNDLFAELIRRIENQPTPLRISLDGLPKMTLDGEPVKLDVFDRNFQRLLKAIEERKS